MPKMHEFGREEQLPSYFMNRIQDFLSAARTNLHLVRVDATNIEVTPVEPYGIAAIDLQGLWRFIEAPVSRAHPGGIAGTYIVWAVGTKQKIVEAPKPFTDETDYSFDLRITSGANPAGAGVEVFEKIGEIDWSGAAIATIRQTFDAVSPVQTPDGFMSGTGDLDWTRGSQGAWIPSLKANSVGAGELADLSVDTEALIDLAVVTAKVAALAITEGKLAPNSVATEKIIALAVTSAKLAAGAVLEEKLGNEAVSTAKMKLLAVTSAILAAESVTEAKVGALAISEAKLAAEAVGTGKIKNLAVTAAKIAEEAVTTIKLANLGVTTAKIAELAITEAKIADAAVTSRKIKLTSGVVAQSEDLALTVAYQEVPGSKLEITPPVASIIKIEVVFDLETTTGGNTGPECNVGEALGILLLDGAEQVGIARTKIQRDGPMYRIYVRKTVTQVYRLALTAAKHTILLQAKKVEAGGVGGIQGNCYAAGTRYVYDLSAS